ncbi:GAL4 [Emericellopsis cladophorae]|uniref:GAL4 n=1 Tax=Emericellopsis cladophorae TaxID=2686198 RepID=A0A9P9Y120_9HYPO|nr:GAL4 [Emericellopsis cladophorae]KAI6781173.1 GAL4 [Emericellopsis cladophorae]
MPRPKVHPSQRQRASEACNACREAKKRCSGTTPCTHCLRRGMGSSCVLTHRPRGHRSSMPEPRSNSIGHGSRDLISIPTAATGAVRPNISAERSSLQSPMTTLLGGGEEGATPAAVFEPISPSDSRTTTDVDGSLAGQSASGLSHVSEGPQTGLEATKPASRMLLNLKGERVYIGGGGSLSFLQLVRGIVSDQIGPSQFSRQGNSDTMLEKESPQAHTRQPGISDLSPEAKLMCADCFYGVTGGLIDVFLPNELEAMLTSTTALRRPQRSIADLVVAIGLQCEASGDTHDREISCFRESQVQVFSGMLEDPDIDMVRTFLIMSFYLLGECRRNTAFLYLGIATRAAVALGLHSRETYTDMNDPKHQLRLRVWMSLRVLDIVVNSILGRPAATAGVHSDLQSLIDSTVASSDDRGLICLGASYRIVALINNIVDTMYDKKEITVPAVEEHLRQLGQWSQDLPDFLRTSPQPDQVQAPGVKDKGAIGRVHVSCLYYFAVTIVTRPILVATLAQQPASGLVHTQLASACLDAAMFTIQTCSGAQKHNLLLANMCILKAIIFPAGLVLGFEIFAKGTVDYGIESAFHNARDILSYLGRKSPQAALYHDILTSLANAITEYRQRAVAKGRSSYVSKLFNFDRAQSNAPMGGGEASTTSVLSEGQMDGIMATLSFGQNTPVGNGEPGDLFMDWDSLDISQWDSFPYLS